jgi:hypothetical protein
MLRLTSVQPFTRMKGIHEMAPMIEDEPRWPPALAILAVLFLMVVLPHHVLVMPIWISRLAGLAVLVPMAAVALTTANTRWLRIERIRWLRIERMMIMFAAVVYIANTIVELADMIGIITLHPPESRPITLLSSSVAIWLTNVLTFSFLYWQIDRGGPYAWASGRRIKPDWLFPQAGIPEDVPPNWRPFFLDYLFLGYNTATAFSPTDVLPLTRRAKMLMMIESTISLVTIVLVAARAVNVLP